MLQIPNGIALVAYRWSLAGDPEELVCTTALDFAAMAGDDQANAETAATLFLAAVGSNGAGMSNQYTFKGVTCRVGYPGGDVQTIEAPRAVQGQFTGPPVPQNCAILIRKRTAVKGRRGVGRMYMPPFMLQENAIDQAGVISAANLPGIQANINLWFDPQQPWRLLHGDTPGPMDPTPITSHVVDGVIATQRRRLRR